LRSLRDWAITDACLLNQINVILATPLAWSNQFIETTANARIPDCADSSICINSIGFSGQLLQAVRAVPAQALLPGSGQFVR
jgi:hypothetical protein